jgi:hypothetical protein
MCTAGRVLRVCVCCRWLEQQQPNLPCRVYQKVADDGRAEFTLSRTRANWRRLTLLRDALAPAHAAFAHLCSWSNLWHSGGWYCVILLFGVWPSRVLAVLLLLAALALLRSARLPAKQAPIGSSSGQGSTAAAAAAAPAPAAAGTPGAVAVVAAAGSYSPSGLLPQRLPPVMWDPAYAAADEAQVGPPVASDPYTSLKQNYEAVIGFLTLVSG